MHCNDTRDEFDSGADRHANLGAGQIDPDLLAAVVRDAGAPVVVETPGGAEEHSADIAWLRERPIASGIMPRRNWISVRADLRGRAPRVRRPPSVRELPADARRGGG